MRLVLVPAVLGVALLTSAGRAQQHDPAAAESLFRDAKAAEARGDYRTACAQFADSQRLDPAAGTLLNEADCEEHIGAVATAWSHFVEARDGLARNDDRVPYAQQRVGALEKRVPHLIVRLPAGAPADTRVMRGQVEIGSASLGVPFAVDPGSVTITATPPGGAPVSKDVTLAEGETKDVTVEVVPAATPHSSATETPAAPAPHPIGTPPSPSGGTKKLGWVLGGVGVATLGAGVVTGLMAMSDAGTVRNDCNGSGACRDPSGVNAASDGRTVSTFSTIGFIGGAALIGVGVYLLLTSSPSAPATSVGATPLPGGGGLSLAHTF